MTLSEEAKRAHNEIETMIQNALELVGLLREIQSNLDHCYELELAASPNDEYVSKR